jgi:hypothetical protein
VWLQLKDSDASVFEGEAFDEIHRVYTAIRNIKDMYVFTVLKCTVIWSNVY